MTNSAVQVGFYIASDINRTISNVLMENISFTLFLFWGSTSAESIIMDNIILKNLVGSSSAALVYLAANSFAQYTNFVLDNVTTTTSGPGLFFLSLVYINVENII